MSIKFVLDGAVLAGHVASYYNIPVLLWGYTFDSEFTNSQNYPTILSVLPNYVSSYCNLTGAHLNGLARSWQHNLSLVI